ncbi:MAG TPA: class I SAM-dependent methyltransferase [Usitatibacter sp.]|nr:class I SAM-dependent methyltransferase [Usitatibacter sp.]
MNVSLPDHETPRWYADKVRRYGFDHRGLGFRTRSSQEKRFEALLGLGDFHGKRLLDVGCGFGDFLRFLRARGIEPRYTGLDICEPMVARCRESFAAGAGRFLVGDVLRHQPDEEYDFVIASGIFGLDADGVRERIAPTIERMFSWCGEGMAANFLSARSPTPAEARVYVDPSEALAIGLALTPAARLDHTYLPNDFTVHLYKTPPWEQGKQQELS